MATCTGTASPTVFTNYRRIGEPLPRFFDQVKIWEVALASTAAPTIFDRVDITYNGITMSFADGALRANSPVEVIWQEARNIWETPGSETLERQLCCIVSVGSGGETFKAVGKYAHSLISTLKRIVVGTRQTSERFHHAHMGIAQEGKYFRFDLPPMDDIELHEAKKKNQIAQIVRAYGESGVMKQDLLRYERVAGLSQSMSFLEQDEFA